MHPVEYNARNGSISSRALAILGCLQAILSQGISSKYRTTAAFYLTLGNCDMLPHVS